MERSCEGLLTDESWDKIAQEARALQEEWSRHSDILDDDEPWRKAHRIARAWAGVADNIEEALALGQDYKKGGGS